MATLESDKVDKALRNKMKAEREDSRDWYYFIKDEEGIEIASTSIHDQDLGYVFGHSLVAGKTGISVEEKQNAERAK